MQHHDNWMREHATAARAEGWALNASDGSDNGPWQIQRIDDPAQTPVHLANDRAAWAIVMNGTRAHHMAARDFVQHANPAEWRAMCEWQQQQPSDSPPPC